MFYLQKLVASPTSVIRRMSTFKQTPLLQKGFGVHWQNMHIKERVINTEKSIAVLAICTAAIMLPSPATIPGVTELDCCNSFEEPFDSH